MRVNFVVIPFTIAVVAADGDILIGTLVRLASVGVPPEERAFGSVSAHLRAPVLVVGVAEHIKHFARQSAFRALPLHSVAFPGFLSRRQIGHVLLVRAVVEHSDVKRGCQGKSICRLVTLAIVDASLLRVECEPVTVRRGVIPFEVFARWESARLCSDQVSTHLSAIFMTVRHSNVDLFGSCEREIAV